jgi:uncharacterized protein (UPF0264 family)
MTLSPQAHRPGLLVSVRSAEEAAAALAGGADLIDVKEPSRGSLGRADDATIAAVVRTVGGQRPVSAALGELRDHPSPCAVPGLAYLKWGLAGLRAAFVDGKQPAGGRGSCRADSVVDVIGSAGASPSHWRPQPFRDLEQALAAQRASTPDCRCVIVAYADWRRADAPEPETVRQLAARLGAEGLLLDTFHKDGRTLLDWLTVEQAADLCCRCRRHGLKIALAGSLGRDEIAGLRRLSPDWFAVRGAACRDGRRDAEIDADRVRGLAQLIAEPLTAATSAS